MCILAWFERVKLVSEYMYLYAYVVWNFQVNWRDVSMMNSDWKIRTMRRIWYFEFSKVVPGGAMYILKHTVNTIAKMTWGWNIGNGFRILLIDGILMIVFLCCMDFKWRMSQRFFRISRKTVWDVVLWWASSSCCNVFGFVASFLGFWCESNVLVV